MEQETKDDTARKAPRRAARTGARRAEAAQGQQEGAFPDSAERGERALLPEAPRRREGVGEAASSPARKGKGKTAATEDTGGSGRAEGSAVSSAAHPGRRAAARKKAAGNAGDAEGGFAAVLGRLMEMSLEEVNALEDVSVRVAVCRTMILKAAGGEKSAADWVRDTLGEKPVNRGGFPGAESVKVILFGEG